MKEIKLTIDGKEVQLTEEQLKVLGIVVKENPFKRVNKNESYCFITGRNDVAYYHEMEDKNDQSLYDAVNYFNDGRLAEQVALHQLLYRKLLKFAYENDCEDREVWDGNNRHWSIRYSVDYDTFFMYSQERYKAPGVYFSSEEDTKHAIKEVVEPFIEEHPDFVW